MPAPLVVILAGGGGTRIRHLLPDLPKPLAPVAGRPFLEWVIRYLRKQGLGQIVVSAGFLAAKLAHFASQQGVQCVAETKPLGTGGGFLHAFAAAGGAAGEVLACNGDSLVLAELAPLVAALEDVDLSGALLGVRVPDASRFGTLEVDAGGCLERFAEKHPGAGLVNGGVYLFRRATLAGFPAKRPLSFEYDVFPALLAQERKIKVVSCEAPFLDIGTEDTLGQAGAFIERNMAWFA
jgi:D-glycero-alpha-D-manno-heptose 1-phosphate guanylyltransferase